MTMKISMLHSLVFNGFAKEVYLQLTKQKKISSDHQENEKKYHLTFNWLENFYYEDWNIKTADKSYLFVSLYKALLLIMACILFHFNFFICLFIAIHFGHQSITIFSFHSFYLFIFFTK